MDGLTLAQLRLISSDPDNIDCDKRRLCYCFRPTRAKGYVNGWYDGGLNRSCKQGCENLGLTCSAQVM